MEATTTLDTLIERARHRALWNLIFEQASVGAIAGFAGGILLLLGGTQLFNWYWPVALFVVAAGISAWRTMKSLPSPYAVAQTIDRQLALKDSISTAFHFKHTPPPASVSSTVLETQQMEAVRLASSVDTALAIPFRIPRHFYPALAMAGIVVTLFLIRFGVMGTLDLRAPIVEAVADFFAPNKNEVAARQKKGPRTPGEDPMAIPVDRPGDKQNERDKLPEDGLTPVQTPDASSSADTKDAMQARQSEMKVAGDKQGDDMAEGNEASDKGAPDKNGKEGPSDSSAKNGTPEGKDGAKNGNQQQGNQENASMMDKMRDAMANLMSKMKIPNQGSQQANQKGSSQKGQQKNGGSQQEGAKGQKGEKGQGQQQGKGSPSDDPDADQQGQGEQQAQAGQGKSNDKGKEGGNPNESKSGMGKQDGSKDIKDAEQQAAMGKISEIMGKRAQNITGEVMLEVQSGKQQQLRTEYSQRGASHREAGGEIRRDEIPQQFQQYVQSYFEQVRKGEAAAGKAAQSKDAAVPAPPKK